MVFWNHIIFLWFSWFFLSISINFVFAYEFFGPIFFTWFGCQEQFFFKDLITFDFACTLLRCLSHLFNLSAIKVYECLFFLLVLWWTMNSYSWFLKIAWLFCMHTFLFISIPIFKLGKSSCLCFGCKLGKYVGPISN
jgi:hypothetical protein